MSEGRRSEHEGREVKGRSREKTRKRGDEMRRDEKMR